MYSPFESCLEFVDEIKSGTIPADALATVGASALAGIVLVPKAGIFRFRYD